MPRLGWIVLVLSLAAAVVGALVPAPVMGFLRTVVPGFAKAWDWLDASLPWLNPLHAIAYAWIALAWRLAFRGGSKWKMPVVLAVIGVTTEALQHFVPGRQPRVTDWLSDLLGIAIGWTIAAALGRLRGERSPTPRRALGRRSPPP